MTQYVGGKAEPWEKVMYVVLGLLVVATLVSLPFMRADRQAGLDKEWAEKKCKMYSDDKLNDVPAKCNNDFVDHESRQP